MDPAKFTDPIEPSELVQRHLRLLREHVCDGHEGVFIAVEQQFANGLLDEDFRVDHVERVGHAPLHEEVVTRRAGATLEETRSKN